MAKHALLKKERVKAHLAPAPINVRDQRAGADQMPMHLALLGYAQMAMATDVAIGQSVHQLLLHPNLPGDKSLDSLQGSVTSGS